MFEMPRGRGGEKSEKKKNETRMMVAAEFYLPC
jgi:hypothetical protein